jgi:hypothetical protein
MTHPSSTPAKTRSATAARNAIPIATHENAVMARPFYKPALQTRTSRPMSGSLGAR